MIYFINIDRTKPSRDEIFFKKLTPPAFIPVPILAINPFVIYATNSNEPSVESGHLVNKFKNENN